MVCIDNNMEMPEAWTDDRVNDILKAAYELQNLCKTSLGCVGCPFHKINDKCAFNSNPASPHEWNIEKKTVYTVKLPDA